MSELVTDGVRRTDGQHSPGVTQQIYRTVALPSWAALSLIATILFQCGGAVWFAATLAADQRTAKELNLAQKIETDKTLKEIRDDVKNVQLTVWSQARDIGIITAQQQAAQQQQKPPRN